MDVKTTFKRYEYKYLLNANQFEKVFAELNKHMSLDDYGEAYKKYIFPKLKYKENESME